ncbi:hypothetical protein Pyn_37391 [Prunus yedoensis var. nudiflora]|uniref:Uncharacterized protein n=1 Tax=Prunus yedoensis var. nudiflora TaxID=2094558 RepID=A0A314V1H8_PRUYE|nr:hypothetical protein Pyn_37391 [Prunus yedoensis var. nudiflora]
MESHGFEGINLSSKSKIQARLLLKIRTHYCPIQFDGESSGGSTAGFKVFERDDGRTISLGWQDRDRGDGDRCREVFKMSVKTLRTDPES